MFGVAVASSGRAALMIPHLATAVNILIELSDGSGSSLPHSGSAYYLRLGTLGRTRERGAGSEERRGGGAESPRGCMCDSRCTPNDALREGHDFPPDMWATRCTNHHARSHLLAQEWGSTRSRVMLDKKRKQGRTKIHF